MIILFHLFVCAYKSTKLLLNLYKTCFHVLVLLQVPDIDRTIKSQVVATFGDFAQAIGRDITYQLSSLMPVLRHACNSAVELESSDEDDITFINHFRESLLETYTNILQALTDDNAKSTRMIMRGGVSFSCFLLSV